MSERIEFVDNNDFSTDLEWMLQSGQADQALLAEALVQGYYQDLYCLAVSLLDDPRQAHRATERAFIAALLNVFKAQQSHLDGETGVRLWIYRLACAEFSSSSRNLAIRRSLGAALPFLNSSNAASVPSDMFDAFTWLAVDQLDWDLRLPFMLVHFHGWSETDTAALLKIEVTSLHSRLEKAWAWVHGALLAENLDIPVDLEEACRQSLSTRWNSPELPPEVLNGVSTYIAQSAGSRSRRLGRWFSIKESLLILLVLIVVGFLVWGVNRFFPEFDLFTDSQTNTQYEIKYSYLAGPGETVSDVANKLSIPVEKLVEWNQSGPIQDLGAYRDLEVHPQRRPWDYPAQGFEIRFPPSPLGGEVTPGQLKQLAQEGWTTK